MDHYWIYASMQIMETWLDDLAVFADGREDGAVDDGADWVLGLNEGHEHLVVDEKLNEAVER